MNSKGVTVVSIVGKRNVGKTTLISKLIPKLKERGHLVGTLKYNIRKFDIDHQGKDTYKYSHSGADTVGISTQNEIAVIKKVKNPPEIKEIMGWKSIEPAEKYIKLFSPHIKKVFDQKWKGI